MAISCPGMAERDNLVLELDGHEVKFSHPDKVFFPERGHTKLDLLRVLPGRGGAWA
jgi:hypothetical protein